MYQTTGSASKFQSTRPRGTRPGCGHPRDQQKGFNPRAHVGRDVIDRKARFNNTFQSTRPRGTRLALRAFRVFFCKFQSTRPRGTRQREMVKEYEQMVFQSTRPRGTRRGEKPQNEAPKRFNPRAHVGRDLSSRKYQGNKRVSIHAPTWDATQYYAISPISANVSIHAPTWDATPTTCPPNFANVSIHAPTWDATTSYPTSADGPWVSIHAPTWDATVVSPSKD